MKIGELARATGTRIETIRFYEREGLLPAPQRTDANYRIYSEAHVQRLAFIRNCRSLDMALEEIKVLLHFKDSPGEDCGAVNAMLDAHIGHVADRVQELQRLEQELRRLRAQCQQIQSSANCGILSGLAQNAGGAQVGSAPGATDHVPGTACPCPRG